MLDKPQRRGQSLGLGTATALALAGWALVLGLLAYGPSWLQTPQLDLTIVWLVLLAVVARLLAFNVHSSSRIAIDSAFYITAVFISGVSTAAAATFAMTAGTIIRVVTATFRHLGG